MSRPTIQEQRAQARDHVAALKSELAHIDAQRPADPIISGDYPDGAWSAIGLTPFQDWEARRDAVAARIELQETPARPTNARKGT
jgi:hypothetical protein